MATGQLGSRAMAATAGASSAVIGIGIRRGLGAGLAVTGQEKGPLFCRVFEDGHGPGPVRPVEAGAAVGAIQPAAGSSVLISNTRGGGSRSRGGGSCIINSSSCNSCGQISEIINCRRGGLEPVNQPLSELEAAWQPSGRSRRSRRGGAMALTASFASPSPSSSPSPVSSSSPGVRARERAMENRGSGAVVVKTENGVVAEEAKLWGGRFEEPVTPAVEKFSQSVSYDQRLWRQDLNGSRAHASMLALQGLITEKDKAAILDGLDVISRRIESGEFQWRADREDVHMNVEAALIDLIGEPGRKLHTARSRNDQVVTDMRLWVRDAIEQILERINHLQIALVKLAVENREVVVPGYTHLQRAQPLLLAHLLLAYVEQFERDNGRLKDCEERLNFCPLGACALAGTGLPIDRFATSDALGFKAPLRNSVDAVSDRDFVLEVLSANAITAVHLSRLAEEWVLWATEEFGFITPSDAVSTGSSIMPQKKNPDPMELVRGKSGRVVGDLTTVLVLCKGLPLAYNRDLQEDKEPLFDSVETILGMLEVTTEFAQNISFNVDRLAKSLPAGHLDATTLADYLVYKGMPFRSAHEVVGHAVALAVTKKVELKELSLNEFRAMNPIFDDDVYSFLGVKNSISKFRSYGSTGADCVAEQLQFWMDKLGW